MKLVISNVSKTYGKIQALKNISMSINSGEVIGFLGRNGVGKSTLIKCIVGIVSPDRGEILLDGKFMAHSDVKIGYLPEERGLYLNVTVNDQLHYFAALNNMNKKLAERAIDYYLETFEIVNLKKRKIKTLSKGNKQKIQLIAAILHEPELVILDEPFSGLDPVNSMMFKNIIAKLKENGKIIIISSHQIEGIQELCDRVIMIKDGTILLDDSIKNIFSRYFKHNIICTRTDNQDKTKNILDSLSFQYTWENEHFLISYKNENELSILQKELIKNQILITTFNHEPVNLQKIFVEELK